MKPTLKVPVVGPVENILQMAKDDGSRVNALVMSKLWSMGKNYKTLGFFHKSSGFCVSLGWQHLALDVLSPQMGGSNRKTPEAIMNTNCLLITEVIVKFIIHHSSFIIHHSSFIIHHMKPYFLFIGNQDCDGVSLE